jgi:CDGSH-type Zn-finger protein
MLYTAEKTEELWFCGCKATDGKPFCDGTHNTL